MGKYQSNPEIRKALASGPKEFALLSLAFIEKYGEEAKELIRKTVYEDSLKKGQKLAKKATNVNDLTEYERLQTDALNEIGCNTPEFNDPARHFTVKSPKKCVFDIEAAGGCELALVETWRNMGLDEATIKMLGELRCIPRDTGSRHGFNPKIKFKFTKWMPQGDPYCEWHEELDSTEE